MPDGGRTPDPPFTGHFKFEVDDVEIGAFTEVSGLSVQVGVEELPEGGENQFVHKLPGPLSWPHLVLKRGITDSDSLFAWFARSAGEVDTGATMTRSTGRIVVLDAAREEVRGWQFRDAFPVRWSGPTLAASASEVAVEELEIAHHGFEPAEEARARRTRPRPGVGPRPAGPVAQAATATGRAARRSPASGVGTSSRQAAPDAGRSPHTVRAPPDRATAGRLDASPATAAGDPVRHAVAEPGPRAAQRGRRPVGVRCPQRVTARAVAREHAPPGSAVAGRPAGPDQRGR